MRNISASVVITSDGKLSHGANQIQIPEDVNESELAHLWLSVTDGKFEQFVKERIVESCDKGRMSQQDVFGSQTSIRQR